jgi:hypothetical protein
MPRPIERARNQWLANNPAGDFTALIAAYLTSGFVYAGEDAFILAQPVGDTWFVHLAAGNLSRFAHLAPFVLPHVAWHRRGVGRLRTYSWSRFVSLAERINR